MTGVLRPAPTAVPAIGPDVRSSLAFERTGTALARSVAAPAAARPARAATPDRDDLGTELRSSLLLIAAVLLPALVALTLLS